MSRIRKGLYNVTEAPGLTGRTRYSDTSLQKALREQTGENEHRGPSTEMSFSVSIVEVPDYFIDRVCATLLD